MRPMPLLFGALAIAGIAKTGAAVLDHADAPRDLAASTFLAAAEAAGAEGTDEVTSAPADEPLSAQMCEETPEAMLQAVREERALLEDQKERLAQREAEIELASEKLDIDRQTLTELRDEVQGLLNQVEQAHTADVDRLVALYSAMKPKEAAAIMNDLDIEVSVMVLGTMPERDAAPILAQLSMVRARAISRIILERSKLPGDQRLDGLKL